MYRRQQRGNSGNDDDDDGGDGGGGGGGNGDSHVPPWLVRAEVTIRRGNAVTSETVRVPPGTTTTTDAPGIRMICRWNTSETSPATPAAPIPTPAPAAASSSPRVDGGDRGGGAAAAAGGFGFQRGNILFTSTPPERPSPAQPRPSVGSYTLPRSGSSGNDDSVSSARARAAANISDSGYTSEQFSHPLSYSSLPSRRQSQQYNRRCKSTCSIVLQSIAPAGADKDPGSRIAASPATKSPKIASVDPWQQYRRPSHQLLFPPRHQFSTVPEVCEDCAEGGVASSAFTTHFCTRVAEKSANRTAAGAAAATTISKDVASQTTDVESVRSSSTVSKGGRVRRRPATGAGQSDVKKKEQEIRSSPASAGTSGSAPPPPPPADPEKSDSSTREDSSKRKSRTVHIDVYCTGSDDDLGTDSTSDDERSTPMTVFENEDVRITHTQATNDLPRGFQDENAFLKRSAERRCASFRNAPMRMPSLASSKGYDSDEMLSSLYPSRFSSYSALRDLDSSVPWSAASSSTMMSCENDSATMTSSKDTFSDVESLINSRSGLTPCDSFEYANSTDRDRIRRLDLGAKDKSKNWRSPQIERRQLLRSKRMKEYMEKHELGWSDDSAEESDESGAVGWSFVSGGGADDGSRLAKRGGPRGGRAKESNVTDLDATDGNARGEGRPQAPGATRATAADHVPPYSGVLRDRIGPFGSKRPSPLPSTIPSRVTSPFTTPYGERTDHIVKASMFGAVISAFRKPGHHIGPAKNPSCACEHCRRFFEETRRRSSSLSELERHPGFKPQK